MEYNIFSMETIVLCKNPIQLTPEDHCRVAVAINDMMMSGCLPEHVENYNGWDAVFPAGPLDIAIKRPLDGGPESLQVFESLPTGKNGLRAAIRTFVDKAPQPPQYKLPERNLLSLHNRVMGDQLIEE